MRLKKVKILGFKSFADKTVTELTDGITAVVGPNGCGKSNYSDAIRWVLGDQSTKSMRAEKMQDVIFAGAGSRRASNLAEVSITFDQVNGALPIEYDEVTISRILHRDGESDYQLNGKSVRLKDIQALLWDTGLGKEALSSIGQGQIEQVISMSNYERRQIFEEAAGILRFKQRKKEALTKLEGVDTNLRRVLDVHKEVATQMAVLEQQAGAATRHKQQALELERLERTVALENHKELSHKKQQIRASQDAARASLSVAQQAIDAEGLKVQESRAALGALNDEVAKLTKICYQTQGQVDTKIALVKAADRQRQELERSKVLLAQEEQDTHKLIAKVEAERTELASFITSRGQDVELAESESAKRKEAAVLATAELDAKRQELSSQQKATLVLIQEENTHSSALKEARIREENTLAQLSSLDVRLADLKTRAHTAETSKTTLSDTKNTMVASVAKKQAALTASEASLKTLTERLQASKEQQSLLRTELANSEARQKALLRLKAEMEGLSSGAKTLLRASEDKASPLFGKLQTFAESIHATKGLEKAVAAQLKSYAHTLVVSTDADLEIVLSFANKKKLGDFSICSRASFTGSTEFAKASVGLFFADVLLVDDVLAVKRKAKQTLLARDGSMLDDMGVYFSASSLASNAFEREAELSTLLDEIAALQAKLTEIQQILDGLVNEDAALRAKRTGLDKDLRQEEMRLLEVSHKLRSTESELEGLGKQEAAIIKSSDELKANLLALAKRGEHAEQKLAELALALKAARANFASAEEDLKERERKALGTSKSLDEARGVLESKRAALASSQNALKLAEHSLSSAQDQVRRQKERQMRAQESLATLGLELARTQTEITELQAIYAEKNAVLKETEKRAVAVKATLRSLDEGLKRLADTQKTQEIAYSSLVHTLHQLDTALLTSSQQLQTRYEKPLEELFKLDQEPIESIEKAEKRIAALRKGLEKNGDVNMAAIAEFDKHKTRHEFIQTQVSDLEKSKKELAEIVSKLDSSSRRQFKKTFEAIRLNFKKHFTTLFEGGEADLVFTDSKDVLEAGVDIVAKPPQKQLRSISLMSGGEKCLTAMALLFSIFETRPSAFCILDEIDAPLDDTNVARFIRVVKEFNHKTQFIIVTHNKLTMAAADTLYGVSMQERGVSRLLQLTLDAALV